MITGSEELSEDRCETVERILRAALQAVDPQRAVENAFSSGFSLETRSFTHASNSRVRLVGAGKAVYAMARGALAVWGDRITDGVLIAKHRESDGSLPEKIRVYQGNHPVPGPESVSAAQALAQYLQDCREDDLVICLISGGGSALMTMPAVGLDLADLQELTRLLLASGADIGEINTLRKHFDRIKGGGLARMASPARVVTLILSDVIGSPLDVIASGPTVSDPTTYGQALSILGKYGLEQRAPAQVMEILRRGARGELPETVKPDHPLLARVQNHIVGSNIQAAQAALTQAQREGFSTLLVSTYLQGEASQVGGVLAAILRQVDASGHPLARPACLVAGGETTVTLRGKGRGGRNQELALGAAPLLDGLPDVALVTLGTDGEDGPTNAAGAFVSGATLARARIAGLDALAALQNNNSYPFFQALGNLVLTGPTGTNVNDLAFLFAF